MTTSNLQDTMAFTRNLLECFEYDADAGTLTLRDSYSEANADFLAELDYSPMEIVYGLFMGPLPEGTQLYARDGNSDNLRLENIAWY